MTHSVPSALLTKFQNNVSLNLATLFHIQLWDDTTFTLTDWNESVSSDLLGSPNLVYTSGDVVLHSDIVANINSAIDDTQLTIILTSDSVAVVADDVRRGRWSAGIVTIGYVDPNDTANSWLRAYFDISDAKIDGLELTLELLGPERRLEKNIGRVLTVNCPWKLGDKNCSRNSGVTLNAETWAAQTAYSVGDVVQPTTPNNYWYKCTTAGTSSLYEPVTWPTTVGNTVVDGDLSGSLVTWTCILARKRTGTVTSVTDRKNFSASGISVTNDFFGEGFLTWLTGSNAGDKHKIESDNGSGAISLHVAAFDTIQVGDTFEATAGCRLRIYTDCRDKWSNIENFGGFPFLAEENVTVTAKKG